MAEQQEPLAASELDLLLKGAAAHAERSGAALAQQCEAALPGALSPQQLKGLQELRALPCMVITVA